MGLSKDQADTFLFNQEPTGLIRSLWHAGFLVSEADPVPGPGTLHPYSSLRLRVGTALLPLPGPPAPTWVALGGAGLQGPEPCLCGRLPALPPPGATPQVPPAKFPRGCLIRRALAAHSWVWFFAVSGCSLEAMGEAAW